MRLAATLILLLPLAACAAHRPPPPTPPAARGFVQEGVASWYGPKFQGRPTASGEIFDMHRLTAAHRTLPLGTRVRVVNLENGRSVVVRINDRGPFVKNRILDLSYAAARRLGFARRGTARVRIEVLDAPAVQPGAYVQLGAFRDRRRALAMLRRFRHLGPARIAHDAGRGVWRVRIGPVPDGKARRLRARLAANGVRAIVVHE